MDNDDVYWLEGYGPGPFVVMRSSDGETEGFVSRDQVSGIGIPAKDRNDAYALTRALNRAVHTHVARALQWSKPTNT